MESLLKQTIEDESWRLVEMLGRCIVPIFKLDQQAHPKHLGTGFLVSASADIFLISAAHVLEKARDKQLFISIRSGCLDKINGKGLLTELPKCGRRDADVIDVGVLKITSTFGGLDLKYNPKQPLGIDRLLAHALPRDNKDYMLVGPRSQYNSFHKEIRIKFHALVCSSSPYAHYNALKLLPFTHLVLSFDEKKAFSVAGARTNRFPPFEGMSGSPVFLFEDKNANVDPLTMPVVGVFTGRSIEKKELLFTDIGKAIHFIRKFS
jgi:hypothetical protein